MTRRTSAPIQSSRKWLFAGILLLFMAGLFEGTAYVATRLLQTKWMMYRHPTPPTSRSREVDYTGYRLLRDQVLGWPWPDEYGTKQYTENGGIIVPANDLLGDEDRLITLYGDSYTKAATKAVTLEQAWPNQLALALGKRIENSAASGYGSDQAYMRFLDRGDQSNSPIVILGHMSENITRNLTRYRDFTNYSQWFAFKPRFDLDASGALVRIPIPDLSEEDYARLIGLSDPPFPLEHENFGLMGHAGAVLPEFPFTVSLIKNFDYWRFKARLRSVPPYRLFYDPEHPFRGLEITEKILAAFHREAIARGQHPLVLLYPGPSDVELARETGQDVFSDLEDRLTASGVEFLNLTSAVLKYSEQNPDVPLYLHHHFAPELNQVTAEQVQAKLERLGWVAQR